MEDLRFPASTINPTGVTAAAGRDADFGWLTFDSGTPEVAAVQVQLPHSWKEGSVLKPHVHWMKSTAASGGVYWQLQYRWLGIGDVMAGSWTTIGSGTPTISDSNLQYKHALTQLGDITAVGKTVSDMLVMLLTRQPANAADTYGADAILLEFDIHYQVDSFGSNYEYYKYRP
jgi:hypothetical protein